MPDEYDNQDTMWAETPSGFTGNGEKQVDPCRRALPTGNTGMFPAECEPRSLSTVMANNSDDEQ
ncbi:hypothetical protein [Dickeya solani]|uniref:hypothetical protein n=1 Tax=Dickeya solani TaxID=1089444 RepID=UPI0003A06483|nr:hypothetical protein [Dickeya solani]ANE75898.1 hypothetical protein A4U42_11460 [Dickeya solani IPO 2222]AUC43404.1 hypothetical protein D083_3055 [Dickeya solani RNS 08.23.3.1.A]AUH08694.1 hypothetical protein BJD21_09580 [Dickeya solani D s0432-1]AUH12683.1 hypothetical protein BJJ98_09545 [Dickeya solani]MCZ0792856.1 hypothetical protein [Dickeya solani]